MHAVWFPKRTLRVTIISLALALVVGGAVLSGSSANLRVVVGGQGQGTVRAPRLVQPIVALGAVTEAEVGDAVDLDPADVVSITFGTSDVAGLEVFDTAASFFPVTGSSYFVMSTGDTSSALTANTDPDTSTILGGSNTSQGNDLVQTVLVLDPPPNATCVAFDFAFYSEEFPEFVGSIFNDAFIAEIGQSTFQIVDNQVIAPNNFAFDTLGNVTSINTVFGVTAGDATDTTYDAATPLLTAVSPLENDQDDITITLSIMDLGDSIYDSTVFVDNVRWFFGLDCEPGADADSDGDSLLDDWETNGIDFDNDSVIDLDLPAMGADPDHKDIFIEIDYMVLGGAGGHTHKPKADALQIAIDTFDNAPLDNPDGIDGIHLHIDAGADTIMNPVTGDLWGAASRSDALAHQVNLGAVANPYDWSAFDAIKGLGVAGSFSIERADVFHYCIFAHNLAPGNGSTSGIARDIPSSDFLVSLGGWTSSVGTTNEQAGTLIHELGHNLGLRHGGDDHANYKPNYLSVMNYFFQTRGLRVGSADGTFDYSRFLLPSLDETCLNEPVGLSGVAGTAGYGTRFYAGGVSLIDNNINDTIDWNNDGDGGADACASENVNNGGGLTVLGTSDNWAELVFDGGAVGHLGEMITLPATTVSTDIDQETDSLTPTEVSVGVGGPGAVTLQACESAIYQYTVLNTGDDPDVYDIEVSTTQPWADTSGLPAVLALGPGESMTFDAPVNIPEGTPDGTVDLLVVTATSQTNPLMTDSAETTTTTLSPDFDGDGFTDLCDACPDSDLSSTIVIEECDSGVSNQLFDDGCTMSDLIAACAEGTGNHGGFVSCVTQLTNEWKQAELITGAEHGAIVSCAAQSNIP